MRKYTIIICGLLALIIGVVFGYQVGQNHKLEKTQIPITENQNTSIDNNWLTNIDPISDLTFKYPKDFSIKYITTAEWPPKIQLINKPFECAKQNENMSITVNNHPYCLTKVIEGAAGSVYTQYIYAFPSGNQYMTLDFTLRSVQCGNYNEPEKSKCEEEQKTFNIDRVVDQIAGTIKQ